MRNTHSTSKPKRRFWQGRGFYIVLTLCLVAVGGLGIVTLVETVSLTQKPSATTTTTTAYAAGQTVPTVPDMRTTATTATTAAPTTTTRSTASANTTPDLFILPLSNEVITVFSDAPIYSETMDSWRVHMGTDFAGTLGQEVKALADGTVQRVYTHLLWGECMLLDHGGGVTSLYCGVHPSVEEGTTVRVGQSIGVLTEIPCESRMSPHLHLEISSGGSAVDPVKAIGREVHYITG